MRAGAGEVGDDGEIMRGLLGHGHILSREQREIIERLFKQESDITKLCILKVEPGAVWRPGGPFR